MHPIALLVMADMALFCVNNNLDFIVTDSVSTLKEDQDLKRKSSTHRTGRAFDLSIKSWFASDIEFFKNHFNKKFESYAAITNEGNPELVIYHVGTAPHLHVQINAQYSNDININERIYDEY